VALFRELRKNVVAHSDPASTPSRPPLPPLAEGLAAVRRLAPDGEARWLLVDVAAQRLHLMAGSVPLADWTVSTAAAGIDAREGSGGTPPGVHRILRRIGAGAPVGMVFLSREPIGLTWPAGLADGITGPGGEPLPADLILTRILTLDGLEDGVNRGPGVDSVARYIYIHGTNAEDRLGTPCSHGCVRMANADVATLFDQVREGDPVVII
jgi:UDP-N-acetylmuramate--alanine ligase